MTTKPSKNPKKTTGKANPPNVSFEVKSYQLVMQSRQVVVNEGEAVRYHYPYFNIFSDPAGGTATPSGQIFFYPSDYDIPNVGNENNGLQLTLGFHIEWFDDVQALLDTPGKLVCAVKYETGVVWGELDGPIVARTL